MGKKLLLILGAGASRPYGLPTSSELRHLILGGPKGREAMDSLDISVSMLADFAKGAGVPLDFEKLLEHFDDPNSDPLKEFLDYLLSTAHVNESRMEFFREMFRKSDRVSIDAFISRWGEELGEIGQKAVAAFLLLCEREIRVNGDWYQQFNEALLKRIDKIEKGDIRVLTFNYDRTLEQYLWNSLRVHFCLDNELTTAAFEKVEIHHVYGSLGALRGERPIKFGARTFQPAAAKIRLATERAKGSEDVIPQWVGEADRIVFLGFGFWPENIELLKLPKKKQERFSSARGLPRSTQADMRSAYGIRFGPIDEFAVDYVINTPVFSWAKEEEKKPKEEPSVRYRTRHGGGWAMKW